MRMPSAVLAQIGILLAVGSVPASAQTATTSANPDVVAAPAVPGNGVVLDPGGGVTQPLREPGEPDSSGPIQLHMPAKHVAQHKRSRALAKVDTSTSAAPEAPAPSAPVTAMPAPPLPPHKLAKKTPAAAASTAGSATTTSSDAGLASAVPFSFVTNPGDTPPRVAKASPPPPQSVPPDANVELNHGLARQSQIIFAPGAPGPSSDAVDAIKGLAGPLNAALAAGASRIQVVAFGGNRGDHSSDARRLSLKRALTIRQLLIDGGVPASRIDVRAMGGATDSSAADRVDVFTKA